MEKRSKLEGNVNSYRMEKEMEKQSNLEGELNLRVLFASKLKSISCTRYL
jgi:hypothetical protein